MITTVVNKYIEWLVNQPLILSQISELAGKRLGCYCSPQACHGDVLAELCNSLFK